MISFSVLSFSFIIFNSPNRDSVSVRFLVSHSKLIGFRKADFGRCARACSNRCPRCPVVPTRGLRCLLWSAWPPMVYVAFYCSRCSRCRRCLGLPCSALPPIVPVVPACGLRFLPWSALPPPVTLSRCPLAPQTHKLLLRCCGIRYGAFWRAFQSSEE